MAAFISARSREPIAVPATGNPGAAGGGGGPRLNPARRRVAVVPLGRRFFPRARTRPRFKSPLPVGGHRPGWFPPPPRGDGGGGARFRRGGGRPAVGVGRTVRE